MVIIFFMRKLLRYLLWESELFRQPLADWTSSLTVVSDGCDDSTK